MTLKFVFALLSCVSGIFCLLNGSLHVKKTPLVGRTKNFADVLSTNLIFFLSDQNNLLWAKAPTKSSGMLLQNIRANSYENVPARTTPSISKTVWRVSCKNQFLSSHFPSVFKPHSAFFTISESMLKRKQNPHQQPQKQRKENRGSHREKYPHFLDIQVHYFCIFEFFWFFATKITSDLRNDPRSSQKKILVQPTHCVVAYLQDLR